MKTIQLVWVIAFLVLFSCNTTKEKIYPEADAVYLNLAKTFTLTNDICHLIEKNPVLWNWIAFDRERIVSNCRSNNLIQIFKEVYDEMARCNHASMWICKSMANIQFADQMEDQGLEPLYIYLYRISYEALTGNPKKEMSRLADFLKLPNDPAIFNYYQSDESKNTSSATGQFNSGH